MKNLKIRLLAVALLVSFSAAFTMKVSAHRKKQTDIKYYAITNDGGSTFYWTTVAPPRDGLQYDCLSSGMYGTFCEVTIWDGYVPQNNTPIPAIHTGNQGLNGTFYYHY